MVVHEWVDEMYVYCNHR